MDIDQIVADALESESSVLELYGNDESLDQIYDRIIVPDHIEHFVNDLTARKLILPPTLRQIDHRPTECVSMSFNIPRDIEQIQIRDTNLVGMNFIDLFPQNYEYYSKFNRAFNLPIIKYVDCLFEGRPLNIVLMEKLYEYFKADQPSVETAKKCPHIAANELGTHNRRFAMAMDRILWHELGKLRIEVFKEELIAAVFHPDRLDRFAAAANMETMDYLDIIDPI